MARELYRLEDEDGEAARFFEENDRFYRLHSSRIEDRVLAENAEIRNGGGARKMDWGVMRLNLTMAQLGFLQKINPALTSPDSRERSKAWRKIWQDGGYRDLTVSKG